MSPVQPPMPDIETEALQALDCLLLSKGIDSVHGVLEKFEERVTAWFPGQEPKLRRIRPATTISPLPAGNLGTRRRGALIANQPGSNSDSAQSQVTISMSDSSNDETKLVPLPPPVHSPSLTAVLPTPSLVGKGGHIFPIKPSKRPDPAPPTSTSCGVDFPDFHQYNHLLQYCGDHAGKTAQIHHPATEDIGDGDAWYYVTVGRTVGVFNTWAQVKPAITGILDAVWKCVSSKEIAYGVMKTTLTSRAATVVKT